MTVPRAARRLRDPPFFLRMDLKLIRAPSARYRPTPCLRVSTFILPAGRFARVTMA
jgi:hypothetical protein